jgi:hypothetical protein
MFGTLAAFDRTLPTPSRSCSAKVPRALTIARDALSVGEQVRMLLNHQERMLSDAIGAAFDLDRSVAAAEVEPCDEVPVSEGRRAFDEAFRR